MLPSLATWRAGAASWCDRTGDHCRSSMDSPASQLDFSHRRPGLHAGKRATARRRLTDAYAKSTRKSHRNRARRRASPKSLDCRVSRSKSAPLANAGVASYHPQDWSERGKGEDLRSLFLGLNNSLEVIEEAAFSRSSPPIQGIAMRPASRCRSRYATEVSTCKNCRRR